MPDDPADLISEVGDGSHRLGDAPPRPAQAVVAVSLRRRWAPDLLGMAASAVVLAAAWWWFERVAGRLPDLERWFFTAVNGGPDWLLVGVWPLMQLGSFWVVVVGPVVTYAIWRRPAPAVTVAGATVLAWLLAKVVKELAGRGRPGDLLGDVVVRDGALDGLGFVSGHSAVAFALATALWPWFSRRWAGIVAYTLALGVAMARLYVGAHLPLDVVGGAAVGIMCGLAVRLAVGEPDRRRPGAPPPASP